MEQSQVQGPVIRLERDASYPSREILVGVGDDEVEISDQVTAAILGCRRIFPHVVDRLAENRMRIKHPDFRRTPNTPPSPELLNEKGMVRDELLRQIGTSSLYRVS